MLRKQNPWYLVKKNITKKNQNVVLNLDGEPVTQAKTFKYLGITLDENLTYNCHINSIIKYANHKLYLLRRCRKYLNTETAILLYKSHILPIIEYGDTLYMSANSKHLERLQIIQNSGLKSCLETSKRTNTNVIHSAAKINTLIERREVHLLKDMFKRSFSSKYIEPQRKGAITRSMTSKKLYVPRFLNCQSQKSVQYRGSVLWNNQSKEIKNIIDPHLFNLKMKKVLKSKLSEYNNK